MKPALTFTPVMFKAAIDRRKDVTRRVATTGNQNQLDQLAAAHNPIVWRIEFKLL
jgi:hypothetical protein